MIAARSPLTRATRLDLWVAATMPETPTLERTLARAGIAITGLRAVREQAIEAGLRDGMLMEPEHVMSFFGKPSAVKPNQLLYDLTLWPAHRFVWAISRWGDAAALGLRLRELEVLPPMLPDHVEAAHAILRLGHHTDHEVRCALGDPSSDTGTWRWKQWSYRMRDERHELRFAFAWGLLVEVSRVHPPSRPPAARSEPFVRRRLR